MSKVAIVDYALGNLFNVQRALKHFNIDAHITNKEEDLRKAERIVLPGVGAFEEGMKHLKKNKLDEILCELANEGRPILGICLGMQILMRESQEHGVWEGLDLIPGKVVYFSPPRDKERFKIPQIGWNRIMSVPHRKWQGTIMEGVPQESFMYFVHSLYVVPDNSEDLLCQSEYGSNIFCSAIQHDNVMGCQFHPERSGEEGLRIIKNFLNFKAKVGEPCGLQNS